MRDNGAVMSNRKLPLQIVVFSSLAVKIALLFLLLSVLPQRLHAFLFFAFVIAIIMQIMVVRRYLRRR